MTCSFTDADCSIVAVPFELDLPLGAAIVGVSALALLPRLFVLGFTRTGWP